MSTDVGFESDTEYRSNATGRLHEVIKPEESGAPIERTEYNYKNNGIRVRQVDDEQDNKTITEFVLDENNPTGYAQVQEHKSDSSVGTINADNVTAAPTIGQDVPAHATASAVKYLIYNGRSSKRAIVDKIGGVAENRATYLFTLPRIRSARIRLRCRRL